MTRFVLVGAGRGGAAAAGKNLPKLTCEIADRVSRQAHRRVVVLVGAGDAGQRGEVGFALTVAAGCADIRSVGNDHSGAWQRQR